MLRYQIIQQRTARHPLFAPSLSETLGDLDENGEPRIKKYKLTSVEKLLCTSSRIPNAVVLGMLTQLKEGKFHLEDPTGAVQLDLSNAVSFLKIIFSFYLGGGGLLGCNTSLFLVVHSLIAIRVTMLVYILTMALY